MKAIKKFFEDFKKFITRGNVLDMAVGVIVGGAFTAIVTAMTNGILRPFVNWLISLMMPNGGLEGSYLFLLEVWVETFNDAGELVSRTLDMTKSIYIDWGTLISAIVNFLLIAFVLFLIVRIITKINEAHDKMVENMGFDEKKEIRKIRREQKVKYKEAKAIYEARVAEAKAQAEAEAKAAEEKAAEEARLAEEKAMAPVRLLEEIRDSLKKQNKSKKKSTKKTKAKDAKQDEKAAAESAETNVEEKAEETKEN